MRPEEVPRLRAEKKRSGRQRLHSGGRAMLLFAKPDSMRVSATAAGRSI